jgi:hypothetical protein
VVNIFLTIPVEPAHLHFNLLLQAVALLPRSTEAFDLVVLLLQTMDARKIHMESRTYHILLADRFVTLQLSKLLQAKMAQDKYRPCIEHLRAYVRIFSKNGLKHDAGRYLNAVRLLESQRVRPKLPYVPDDEEDDGKGIPLQANTHYLRAFGNDRRSAFKYLVRLLNAAARRESIPRTRYQGLKSRKFSVMFDWTTAFAVAARHRETSSEQLIRLFNKALEIERFRPTVATYTVLLRGLIFRRSYDDAVYIWDRLIADRLVLDRKALGAGVKALTLAGQPLRAFGALEVVCARPDTWPIASASYVRQGNDMRKRRSLHSPQRRFQVDTMTMNDFMVALLRIARPDIVFMMWEHMEMLYNVKPDSHSLTTLCQASRLADRLDANSLAASITRIGLSNPFRRPHANPSNREEAVQTINQMLKEKGGKSAKGIWKNALAAHGVRNAFQEIIFSNWPEMKDINAPAHAVRRGDANESPLREMAQSIAQSLSFINTREQRERELPPHITFASPSQGSIIPSESAFSAYIVLLGTSSYQHEIPLVLAWMRALHIRPRRPTVCFALIFWAEVSLRGPIFEAWAESNDRSEYGKLHKWIKDWIGRGLFPQDHLIAHFLKVVARARDTTQPILEHRKQYHEYPHHIP